MAGYYRSVFRQATVRSLAFARTQGLVAGIALVAVGIPIGFAYQKWCAAVSDLHQLLVAAVVGGLAPNAVLAISVFFYYLVRAPAELAAIQESQYAALEHNRDDLGERLVQLQSDRQIKLKVTVSMSKVGQDLDFGFPSSDSRR